MSLTGDVLGQIGAEVSMNGGVGGSIQFTGDGTDNYDELDNRPSINGVVLTGNKTTADLHIDTGGTDDYLDLNNKPKINSVTLRGDVSSASLQISYNDLTDRPVIPDLTDLENRMDAVEGDIQSIETDIGDIGDRLVDIASDIATIQATDLVQNSDISSLKNRMNAAENSLTGLGSRLTTAEGNITALDGRVTTNEDNITTLQGDMSQAQDDISELNSSLSKLGIFENGGFSSITVSSGTWVKCKEFTLNDTGVYILNSIVSFSDSNTSIYTHRIIVGSNNYNIRNSASNGGGSNFSLIITISTPTTIQLYVNTSFATTANGYFQYVRLT